jgi:peptide/nickel transport system ATP-binding protein
MSDPGAAIAAMSDPGAAIAAMSDTGGPILDLAHVKVTFMARQGFLSSVPVTILQDVSVSLARGETLAVVGESGSGKTTLGRASLRLVPLAAGRVTFEGVDITDLPDGRLKAFRRRAQAMFQDPYSSLSPYMRVLDIVAEPLEIHRIGSATERRERVVQALEQVRLRPAADLLERYPHTLSGGQRQRVNIARAMILEPAYVVADEPVSMIDASSRAEILGLLRGFQEARGVSYLYITHDLASARHFADRIAVMYLGRVVELADARELIDRPLHPYSTALMAAVPEPDPANRRRIRPVVTGEPPSVMAAPSGCPFHPRCPEAIPGTCDVVDPPLIQLGARHQVACHLYPAVVPDGASSAEPKEQAPAAHETQESPAGRAPGSSAA